MISLNCLDLNPTGRPAVLLLHGLGADSRSWSLQIQPLIQAGFRPIAVDAPGFGASPYDRHGWRIPRVAGAMVGLLDELHIGRAHVVGLSMGGTIAQQMALQAPEHVSSLVLVSTFARLRPDNLSGWIYFLSRLVLVFTLGLPAQARLVARRVFPAGEDDTLRGMLVETISRADPRAYRSAMLAMGSFNSLPRLAEIDLPTLVVSGEGDSTVRPARQSQLARGIPGARQVIIPAAGHAVPVDQPEAFNRELLSFFHYC